jgi:hypothetical protein
MKWNDEQKRALIQLLLMWFFCLAVAVIIVLIAKKCEAQEITGVDRIQTGRLYRYSLEAENNEIKQPKILVIGDSVDYEIVGAETFITPQKAGVINIIASGMIGDELFLINRSLVVGGIIPPETIEPPKPVEKTIFETLKEASETGVKKVVSNNKDREKKAIQEAIESVIAKYATTDMTNAKNQRTVRESLRLTVQRNLTNVASMSPASWQIWDETCKEVLQVDPRIEPTKLLEYYKAIAEGLR